MAGMDYDEIMAERISTHPTVAKIYSLFQKALKDRGITVPEYPHLRNEHQEAWLLVVAALLEPKLKPREIFVPFYNADMTEGRGPMVPCDFGFTTEGEVKRYIDGQPGIMGRTDKSKDFGGDWDFRKIKVLNTVEETEVHIKNKLRENALKKLSLAEREALGL